ncbi:hypothetical protein L7F22_023046 [Adiantum nelumboides]|nr:hypothetical protein [Adiantum nelumboides]
MANKLIMAALALLIAAALVTVTPQPENYTGRRESINAAVSPVLNREAKLYMEWGSKTIAEMELVEAAGWEEERRLEPHGSAAALFVLYAGYRGGPNSFAVVGLGFKPLYLFAEPEFECFWVPAGGVEVKSKDAYAMLPDYGFGRVYTTVVINCTFDQGVGSVDGGQLVLVAYHGDDEERAPERFVALTEDGNAYNASTAYDAVAPYSYQYEYLYCGSPLYGNVNAQRMREWMAYHAWLFGPKSHFVFHDAGGMHAEVRAVLEPWQRLGYVSVQNVTRQAEFDAYYYNQFLINNDCLHRTKFLANWTFFFDVDEFIYIAPHLTFATVMNWFRNATMLRFAQLRMSDMLCQDNVTSTTTSVDNIAGSRAWAFEKLVYGETIRDMKYAVQARQVYATGVHYSQVELGHMEGEVGWANWSDLRFYHYHNTINKDGDTCQVFAGNATSYASYEGSSLQLDTSMLPLGPLVKKFEQETIGVRGPSL